MIKNVLWKLYVFSGSNHSIDLVVHFFVLHCKNGIYLNKFLKLLPRFDVFLSDVLLIVKSLKLI